MISVLHARNFKLLADVDIPLERLTVFVGPNGSGKTTVLDCLYCLSQLKSKMPEDVFRGPFSPSRLIRRGATDLLTIQARAETPSGASFVRCTFEAFEKGGGNFHGAEWSVHLTSNKGRGPSAEFAARLGESSPRPNMARDDVGEAALARFRSRMDVFPSALKLRLDPICLAEPDFSTGDQIKIEESGRGLASVLADMALTQPDKFQLLQDSLRSVVPSVKRVRMARAPFYRTEIESTATLFGETSSKTINRQYFGYTPVLDMVGAEDLPSDAASEGTVLVLGLLAALMGSARPQLLLLDDLDRGLHPKAMGMLVQVLRKILKDDENLQIVATTHSPYLVDHLDAREVRLATIDPSGNAQVGSLVGHPDFEKWKDLMLPGEFWSTVGEGWVKDAGKPAHA